jgi:cytochrome c-type biogenesis protein CcmH/NrfF
MLMLLAIQAAWPDEARGDKRLERLFGSFMAPCCWRENLLVHRSPAADELRAEIREYTRAGWTDERIKEKLIETHTRRILGTPEGAQGQTLFWMPWVVLLVGLTVVGRFVSHSVRSRPAIPAESLPQLPDVDGELFS